MPDSKYSERKLGNSFGKNEENKIDNLDGLFKGMGLEPYQFQPTKKITKNHRKDAVRLSRKTSF